MIALATVTVIAFALGFAFGYWSYRRQVMMALERLAHPANPTSGVLDHDAIKNLVERYRFGTSEVEPSTRRQP